MVIYRNDGLEVARVSVGNRYSLHTINAFDQTNRLTLDVLELDWPVYDQYQELPDMFTDAPLGLAVRLTVDLETQRLVDRREFAYEAVQDFAAIDPRRAMLPCDDFWLLGMSASRERGRKFFDELVHVDWTTEGSQIYRSSTGCYLGGEPVFVPDPTQENAGAVISQQMDSNDASSSFVIFDAFDLPSGPRARVKLNSPIRFGFHPSFNPTGIRR
jgi:carotenoid cleavage dioxygenase-like enzyme